VEPEQKSALKLASALFYFLFAHGSQFKHIARMIRSILLSAFIGLSLSACVNYQTAAPQNNELLEALKPGVHTLMYEMAVRHSKLWFSGSAENWQLASYEVHEMEELAEFIQEHHPEYDGIPVGALMEAMFLKPLETVEAAIKAQSKEQFEVAFDRFTTSCNGCHGASNRGFIQIQRPTSPPLTNLRFDIAQ